MLSTILNPQTETINFKISSLIVPGIEEQLAGIAFDTSCGRIYDISSQIPRWVRDEKDYKSSNGIDTTNIYDLVQLYYDWLYCDGVLGAKYNLSKKFTDIIDIDRCDSDSLEKLALSYAPGFDISSLQRYGGIVKEQNLRNFLHQIRRTFYHKKSTEEGIKYFFITLYGVDEEDINIEVPKKNILRLNGGRFYNTDFNFPGATGTYDEIATLSGSYLNGSRIQDGNWIQDWSYLLSVGLSSVSYKETYTNMVHPAGLRVVFERRLSDYQGPEFDENTSVICDYSLLRQYSPYQLSTDYRTYSNNIHIAAGWTAYANTEGITLCGLPKNSGCNGYTGFSGPTNLFPNWNSQYNTFNFFDINIETMLELCYPPTLGSPNSGIPACPSLGP
jgi:hypothetical protein